MKEMADKKSFFEQLPVFKFATNRNMSTLIYHFKEIKKQRGEIIFKEGDEAEYGYVVKKGEVKFLKEVEMPILETLENENSPLKKKIPRR